MLQPLLIQGKGRFNCSSLNSPTGATICNETSPECSPYAITVIPGKTYRLGISSVTTLSALSFQIEVSLIRFIQFSKQIGEHFSDKISSPGPQHDSC